jgi:hypothetical protein
MFEYGMPMQAEQKAKREAAQWRKLRGFDILRLS